MQNTATRTVPLVSTAIPVTEPVEPAPQASDTPVTPLIEITPSVFPPAGPVLAYLKDGDIWLLEEPGGVPYPLTVAGDILGFTWAPNGERLAAFNGHTLCFYHRDGSVRTACLDLGLDEKQAAIERRLVLSPDQRWIVLWNPVNPQDEGALGWMIVALDTSNIVYRIEDPVEWGASITQEGEAGGFTGMPTFLPDGRLVGTLSHRSQCGSGGCHYQLFRFDFASHQFAVFANKPEEGFSEGLGVSLSTDGSTLTNFGTFYTDCDNYMTFIDLFRLSDETRTVHNLEGVAVSDLALNPALTQGVLARTSSCSDANLSNWAAQCGLIQAFDILPMQIWDLASGERSDLLPGLSPTWSPKDDYVAFRSCLAQGASGAWEPSGETAPGLYLIQPENQEIISIGDGILPQWQP
jgi:hypothetical protein